MQIRRVFVGSIFSTALNFPLGLDVAVTGSQTIKDTMMLSCTICVLLISTSIKLTTGREQAIVDGDERRLLNFLFERYDPSLRPVLNKTDSVLVRFGISLHQIIDVDFKNQIVKSSVWIRQLWNNPLLKWNHSEFGGIKVINVDPSKVWRPDLFLYNNVDDSNDGSLDRFQTKVVLNSNGNNLWLAPKIMSSSCKFDVTYFPFDKQECIMKFGSWTYDGFRLDLVPEKHPGKCEGDIKKFIKNGEWELVSLPCKRHEVLYQCCPEPYPDITYTLTLTRRHMFYFINMIAPCFLISALSLLSFYLPPDSGERLTLVITNLLALTVFMLLVVEIIPATSETVPLISVYFYGSVFEVALALVATCIVLRCYFNDPSHRPVPNWARHVVLGWMARLVKVPVNKILHGVSPKEFIKNGYPKDTDVNNDSDAVLDTKIPNRSKCSSLQQLTEQNVLPTMCKCVHSKLNLWSFARVKTTAYRNSSPPINNLSPLTSRAPSRDDLKTAHSEDSLANVRDLGDNHTAKALLDTQTSISKDVGLIAKYVQDQENAELMKQEWILIAVIIDKFFLWVFLLILCISTVVIFMQAPSYAFG